MKKIAATLVIIAFLVLGGLFGLVLYKAPRMRVQEHIRSYQMLQPPLPEGVVPVDLPEQLPSAEQAASVKNPLSDSDKNRYAGAVYYQYYCIFCHGSSGVGDGPVGESYTPRPADLRSERIAALPDGELLRRMLSGVGHEPVLEKVIPTRYRWYIVLYMRSMGKRDNHRDVLLK